MKSTFEVKRVSLLDEPKYICRFDKVCSWPTELGQYHYTFPTISKKTLAAGNSQMECGIGGKDSLRMEAGKTLKPGKLSRKGGELIEEGSSAGQQQSDVLSSFVRSFFQFASDFDQGEVSRVKFSHLLDRSPARNKNGPVLGGNRRNMALPRNEMCLHCMRGNANTVIAVFVQYLSDVDCSNEVRQFLRSIDTAQTEAAGDTEKLRDSIVGLIEQNNKSVNSESRGVKNKQ